MTGDDMGDLARAAKLARSSKDREEHSYAARSVTQVLAAHCASVNVPDEPSVLHLPNVMHLATDITGALSTPVGVLDLVRELHPSAAVCGTPTLAAARVIDELEGLDRARYAGPVGWVDAAGEGEWCIALRSAEISRDDPSTLRLFAGCGIVAASDPASEWAESEAKLEPMRAALRYERYAQRPSGRARETPDASATGLCGPSRRRRPTSRAPRRAHRASVPRVERAESHRERDFDAPSRFDDQLRPCRRERGRE